MTRLTTRLALVVALGLAGATAVGVYAATRDQNTNQPPAPFSGRGGHGGPGRGGFGPGGPMGMLPMLGRELQLTDSQRDQVKAIADSHRNEWQGLAERARTAHQALNDAVSGDTIDETLIRQRSAEVAAVDADMAVAQAHAHAEVLQVLTADQKTKLKELQASRRQYGGGRKLH